MKLRLGRNQNYSAQQTERRQGRHPFQVRCMMPSKAAPHYIYNATSAGFEPKPFFSGIRLPNISGHGTYMEIRSLKCGAVVGHREE